MKRAKLMMSGSIKARKTVLWIKNLQVDLNEKEKSGSLSYATQLANDIANPTNLFLIRVLQYLDQEALKDLLFLLIEMTAPGSVFFIAGNVDLSKPISVSKKATPFTPNYKASFFAPRTDMEFLVHKQVYAEDELLVIRKR